MKQAGIVICLILSMILNANAQTGKVYPRTNIKKGKLKNGLTYYIYKNPSSRGKISFYLIQNVGAILEEDNQNGLSHFLEHMCFNGTKNFPGNAMFEMIEEKNIQGCINAFTGIDKTVYHFINVPTKYNALCDKCLMAMRDWCCDVTFPQEKVNTERFVILEEKRTRDTPESRVRTKNKEAILCNSKYTKRDIIGTEKVIRGVSSEDFIKYYNTWYRPELQAVVVLGDLDMYEIETKIKNLFSTIPAKKCPRERYHINVPDNKGIVFKQIIDPETQRKEIRIKFRHKTKYDIETKYYRQLIDGIIKKRITNILKDNKTTPINYLNIQSAGIAQNYFNYGIEVGYKKGKVKEALAAAISINKDILENGFTKKEFDDAIKRTIELLNKLKLSYRGIPDKYQFRRIEANYVNKEDLLDYGTESKKFKSITKKLTAKELTKKINELYSGSNKSVVVIDKDDSELLSKEEILEIEKNTKAQKYDPNKYENKNEETINLPVKNIKGSKITKREKLDIEDVSVWTLKNGAKIIYKECNTNGNFVLIRAFSNGGSSLLSGKELLYSDMFTTFSNSLGVKGVSKEDFEEFIKINKLQINPLITANDENITIKCKYKNAEQALQLIYSLFEKPIFYKDKFEFTKDKVKRNLSKVLPQYKYKAQDTLSKLQQGDRYAPFNKSYFSNFSTKEMEKVYSNRFSNANDFTFYIIGGIGEAKAKKLAEKYIGSITSTKKQESYKEFENKFPKGTTKVRLKYDIESKKSGVVRILDSYKELSYKEKICFQLLNGYLRDKLTKVIRKLESGTYNVSVNFYSQSKSSKNYGYHIQFDCDPKRAEKLNSMLDLTFSVIAEKGLQQIDLDLLKKPYEKIKHIDKDKVRKDINYYIKVITSYIELGKDITDPNLTKDTIDSIDLKYVNEKLREFLKNSNVLDVIYSPK